MSGWSGASRGLGLAIRFATLELKLWNFIDALERRYSPDQPRVPAGNADGGSGRVRGEALAACDLAEQPMPFA
jgi:hypothetical protein